MLVIYICATVYILALPNYVAGCIARQCLRPRKAVKKEDEIPKGTIYCQQCYSVLECKKPKSVPCIEKYADLTREQFIGQLTFMQTVNLTKGQKRGGKLQCISYSNTSRDHVLEFHMEIRGCFWTENPFLATDNWSGNDYDVGCMLCEVDYCNGLNPMHVYESQYLAQLQDRALNLIEAPMPLRRLFERPTDKPNQRLYHPKKATHKVPAPELLKDLTLCYDWFGGGDDKTAKPSNSSGSTNKRGLIDDDADGVDGAGKSGGLDEKPSNEGDGEDDSPKPENLDKKPSNEGGADDGAPKPDRDKEPPNEDTGENDGSQPDEPEGEPSNEGDSDDDASKPDDGDKKPSDEGGAEGGAPKPDDADKKPSDEGGAEDGA